jgi:hypothetical protein
VKSSARPSPNEPVEGDVIPEMADLFERLAHWRQAHQAEEK